MYEIYCEDSLYMRFHQPDHPIIVEMTTILKELRQTSDSATNSHRIAHLVCIITCKNLSQSSILIDDIPTHD